MQDWNTYPKARAAPGKSHKPCWLQEQDGGPCCPRQAGGASSPSFCLKELQNSTLGWLWGVPALQEHFQTLISLIGFTPAQHCHHSHSAPAACRGWFATAKLNFCCSHNTSWARTGEMCNTAPVSVGAGGEFKAEKHLDFSSRQKE